MFEDAYEVFGDKWRCVTTRRRTTFKSEAASYKYLDAIASANGWVVKRVETKLQQGFPDMLLLRGDEYWLIECKKLKKNALQSVPDDLHWQFGQLAFLKRAYDKRLNYMLSVVRDREIAHLIGAYHGERNSSGYPDFV